MSLPTRDNREPLTPTQTKTLTRQAWRDGLAVVVWIGVIMAWGHTPVAWACAAGLLTWAASRLVMHVQEQAHAQEVAELEQRMMQDRQKQQRLQQQQAQQDRFLGAIGHELRTPMNAILGFNGVLRQHWAQHPEALVRADRIQHTSERMMQHINRLLDDAKLRVRRLTLQPQAVALEPLLLACLQDLNAQDPSTRTALDAQAAQDTWIEADPLRLKQALCCAAEVVRAASTHGALTLTLERDASTWRFCWRTDAQAKRVQPTSPDAAVALARDVCTQLVALQNGQVVFEHRADTNQAVVTLPLPTVPAPQAAQTARMAALRARPWRVLVVDDNELNRVVATMLLRKELPHATVDSCASAHEALTWLHTHPCDFVLMDILMPELDGMSATRALRAQNGPHAHTPVLAMTGIDQPENRMACLAAGMNGLLNKPLRANELLQAMTAALMP